MNRRTILSISAMTTLALALLPTSSIAQQKSLKEQLVGTWTLVSYEITPLNGAKRQIANPKGIFMFDAGGRYATFLVRGDRPKYRSPGAPTTEEIAATVRDYVAGNFGTWSVNEADKTLTRHYDGALNPNNEGTEDKVTVSLSGDELRLTTVSPGGGGARTDTVYRRAR
jgi:Lipocalin-like domain